MEAERDSHFSPRMMATAISLNRRDLLDYFLSNMPQLPILWYIAKEVTTSAQLPLIDYYLQHPRVLSCSDANCRRLDLGRRSENATSLSLIALRYFFGLNLVDGVPLKPDPPMLIRRLSRPICTGTAAFLYDLGHISPTDYFPLIIRLDDLEAFLLILPLINLPEDFLLECTDEKAWKILAHVAQREGEGFSITNSQIAKSLGQAVGRKLQAEQLAWFLGHGYYPDENVFKILFNGMLVDGPHFVYSCRLLLRQLSGLGMTFEEFKAATERTWHGKKALEIALSLND